MGALMKYLLLLLPLMTGGCLAKAAVDVVTLPVKAVGQTADWATTSPEEADRNYGRKMREQEAREGQEAKKAAKQRRKACEEVGSEHSGRRRGGSGFVEPEGWVGRGGGKE